MINQSNDPSTIHIHDLPDEILFIVFSKACEELDFKDLEPNLPEPRRYPIIHTVRAVCRRWWKFIGYYDRDAYNKSYFWYTLSELGIDNSKPPSGSVKSIPVFKHSLDASQKSDIWISIFDRDWDNDIEEFSEADAAFLGLFIRCLDFIIPHQEQIVHYQISIGQPQFLSHLLELLTFRMKHMYRCPTIFFRDTLPPLSDILSATSITPPSLLSHPATTTSSARLTYLDDFNLTMDDISILDNVLMKIPFRIIYLRIPPVDLLGASSFLNAIANDLVSLFIEETSWVEFRLPKVCIAFPRLLDLRIWHASDSWVEYFLKHTTLPSLEVAGLYHMSKSSHSTALNSKPSSDSFVQSLDYPNLQKLNLKYVSLSSFCVRHLMKHTIRELKLELSDPWEESTLLRLLKPIQLEKLRIANIYPTDWKITLRILSSLNLTFLQELDIEASESIGHLGNYQKAFNERYRSLSKLGHSPPKLGSFPIKASLLKNITFEGLAPCDLLLLATILGSIDTRLPITLQIYFFEYDGISPGNSVFALHAPVRVDHPPLITSLKINLRRHALNDHHFLIDILSFAPKLQQLILESQSSRDANTDFNIASITNFFTALTTHDSQGPLLPYLSSLEVYFQVDTRKQKCFLEKIKAIIFDCLVKRHHHGTVSLELCDLSIRQHTHLSIILEHFPKKQTCQNFASLNETNLTLILPAHPQRVGTDST